MIKSSLVKPTPLWPGLFYVMVLFLSIFLWASFAHGEDKPTATMQLQGEFLVGQPIVAAFNLGDLTIPNGAYPSINIRVITMPGGKKPTIKTAFPSTTMVFHSPGEYTLRFIFNQISKPSCGGVDAKLLLETSRTITITR
jgi:hypothetical protein